MRFYSVRAAVVAAVIFAVGLAAAHAASLSPRQYYSSWKRHPQHQYHFRYYYYQSYPTTAYRYDYVIYTPQYPRYFYYYNPRSKLYWGRVEAGEHGGKYSLLKPEDRREKLEDIPESAFPKPADPPPIPGSSDGVTMQLPPGDLPDSI